MQPRHDPEIADCPPRDVPSTGSMASCEEVTSWLAAFLDNRLDEVSRTRFIRFLAETPAARELFLMAFEIYRENSEPGRQRKLAARRSENGDSPSVHKNRDL